MPEDTEQPNAPDNAAPAQPEPPRLAPGQLMLQVSDQGLIVMSMAIAVISPNDFSAAAEDWYLNHHPERIKELVEKHVARVQQQQNRLHLVTDPATVRKVAKSKNRLNA